MCLINSWLGMLLLDSYSTLKLYMYILGTGQQILLQSHRITTNPGSFDSARFARETIQLLDKLISLSLKIRRQGMDPFTMFLLISRITSSGSFDLPKAYMLSIRLLLKSIFLTEGRSRVGRFPWIWLHLRSKTYRHLNWTLVNTSQGISTILLQDKSSLTREGKVMDGRLPEIELWWMHSVLSLGHLDLQRSCTESIWLQLRIRFSSLLQWSSGSPPVIKLCVPETLVNSGRWELNRFWTLVMSLWSNQKTSSLGRVITGMLLTLVLTILKNTNEFKGELARLSMSAIRLRLMSRAHKRGKLSTGREPLILLSLTNANYRSFMLSTDSRDSMWFCLRNSSWTLGNWCRMSMFLILFSQMFTILIACLSSTLPMMSMDCIFLEVSSTEVCLLVLTSSMIKSTQCCSLNRSISSSVSRMSTIRADLLSLSITQTTQTSLCSSSISSSELHSRLMWNLRQSLSSFRYFLEKGFRAWMQFQQSFEDECLFS